MTETFPLFSGPGHIFLFYCFLAFILFAPCEILMETNFAYLFAGLVALGFPLGSLINGVYSCLWNLIGGYVKVGHSRELYKEFKGILSKEAILAIHDKMLWEIASDQSIQYFRRRWAHYHFSAQIAIVSLFAIPVPLLIKYFFSPSAQIFSNLFLYFYISALLLISISMFLICSQLSKTNRFYIAQLFKGHEVELRKRIQEEIAKCQQRPLEKGKDCE
jgi:hypothetical protein